MAKSILTQIGEAVKTKTDKVVKDAEKVSTSLTKTVNSFDSRITTAQNTGQKGINDAKANSSMKLLACKTGAGDGFLCIPAGNRKCYRSYVIKGYNCYKNERCTHLSWKHTDGSCVCYVCGETRCCGCTHYSTEFACSGSIPWIFGCSTYSACGPVGWQTEINFQCNLDRGVAFTKWSSACSHESGSYQNGESSVNFVGGNCKPLCGICYHNAGSTGNGLQGNYGYIAIYGLDER